MTPVQKLDNADGDLMELLFKATHSLQQRFESKLDRYNLPEELTGPRMRAMLEISRNPGIKMSELASRLGIKARTVTAFVDSLEGNGFVKRLPDPADRRATLLQLSDEAMAVMEKAETIMVSISQELLSPLSKEQRTALSQILQLLCNDNI